MDRDDIIKEKIKKLQKDKNVITQDYLKVFYNNLENPVETENSELIGKFKPLPDFTLKRKFANSYLKCLYKNIENEDKIGEPLPISDLEKEIKIEMGLWKLQEMNDPKNVVRFQEKGKQNEKYANFFSNQNQQNYKQNKYSQYQQQQFSHQFYPNNLDPIIERIKNQLHAEYSDINQQNQLLKEKLIYLKKDQQQLRQETYQKDQEINNLSTQLVQERDQQKHSLYKQTYQTQSSIQQSTLNNNNKFHPQLTYEEQLQMEYPEKDLVDDLDQKNLLPFIQTSNKSYNQNFSNNYNQFSPTKSTLINYNSPSFSNYKQTHKMFNRNNSEVFYSKDPAKQNINYYRSKNLQVGMFDQVPYQQNQYTQGSEYINYKHQNKLINYPFRYEF